MAIDPKELRIGSHVEYMGERWEVAYITPKNKILYYALFQKNRPLLEVFPLEVKPIPITPELLIELGFCKKIIGSDWSMLAKDVDSFSISVGIQNHVCKGVEIRDNDDKDAMFGWTSPCKYLHELESFYYHCIGKELITD